MSVILSAYTKDALKEYLLPAINNSEAAIILPKGEFNLQEDLVIRMEVIDYKWQIIINDGYEIYKNGGAYKGETINGGDVYSFITAGGHKVSVIVSETDRSFSVFDKYDISNLSTITIGSHEENPILYEFFQLISRKHAILKKDNSEWSIEDCSANGIFINSRRAKGVTKLQIGDCINIFSLKIVYLGKILAINTFSSKCTIDTTYLPRYLMKEEIPKDRIAEARTEKNKYFHRAPRNYIKSDTDSVEIEAPPTPRELSKKSLFMTIGPTFTMMLPMLMGSLLAIYASRSNGAASSAYMYTGIITAAGSALLGVFWAVLNLNTAKKDNKKEEAHRLNAYTEYLEKKTELIREKYEKNKAQLLNMYPSAQCCCEYDETSTELWNRNYKHEDFMYQRLGLGNLPFPMQIIIPKEKFTLSSDALAEKPAAIKEEFSLFYDVPIGVNLLDQRLIGIVGGANKEGAFAILRLLAAQIAANNCYTDVKMVFINDEHLEGENMKYAKWFPHVWSEDKNVRYVASCKEEASDVLYELTKVLRMRAEEEGTWKRKLPKPHYVLFVSDLAMLEGELISKYIYEVQPSYGLTTIILAENHEQLPNSCEYVIQNDEEFRGIYSLTDEKRTEIKFDYLSSQELESFARRLSPVEVKEVEKGHEIPNSLTFFDMYKISGLDELNVEERWRKNRTYDNMRALIGAIGGNEPCYLDVHEKYHGPHGLIAGTTGSGKSETLQTYLLSLAINFSPDDIGYFIIDYKGGGMANLFEKLPHMIGSISNLTGNQVYRSMVSINSEIKRRQRIFNEHNVNNINQYTMLYKNGEAAHPIPHMFIIIDEFAELKREEPDFMKGLISVAQVGRSLGVHLILATQKPSGTVDENIWSNSRFKLCLRVQDKQDSNDMLHKPDAAYITRAGRCYMQVGNDELYQLFQSGWSGAIYDDELSGMKTDIATMLSLTGKAALVGSSLKRKQQEKIRHRWILSLLQIVFKVLDEKRMALSELLAEPSHFAAVFEAIKNAEMDYPYSEHNLRRMEDMLRLYAIVHMTAKSDLDAEVEALTTLADKQNKKLPESKGKTQLDAVIEYIGKKCNTLGYHRRMQLWMPLLPKHLYLNELQSFTSNLFHNNTWPKPREQWNLEIPAGLCDDPENQAQMPLIINFAENGHHAICGSILSGKSTLLQSVIFALIHKYQPDYVNIYAIDYSSKMLSAFEQAPHVGDIIYEDNDEKLDKFFRFAEKILEDRKQKFSGGNYRQYVQAHGLTVPSIIIAIDNYANFREKTQNKYEDALIHIGREGIAYGIFLIITSAGFGTTEIQSKVGDNIKTVIGLQLQDRFQYADIMRCSRPEVIPESNTKGRGLAAVGDRLLEFQSAIALEAENDYKRLEEIKKICHNMDDTWKGKKAKAIRVIPERPEWKSFQTHEDYSELVQSDRYLPVGYDMSSADIYGIDLSKTYCYMITGASRSGRTNVMKALIHSASGRGGKIAVIELKGEDLHPIAQEVGAVYIDTSKRISDFFVDIVEPFKQRNAIKRQLLSEGKEEEEIYLAMQKEAPYLIFIADMAEFIQAVMKQEEDITNVSKFIENITEKGRYHNFYFFVDYNTDTAKAVEGIRIHENMVSYKSGIHLGGNVNRGPRFFDFSYLPYTEQGKPQKTGIGMLPTGNGEDVARIVIPLVKG